MNKNIISIKEISSMITKGTTPTTMGFLFVSKYLPIK